MMGGPEIMKAGVHRACAEAPRETGEIKSRLTFENKRFCEIARFRAQ
jgi:hypothetical protein